MSDVQMVSALLEDEHREIDAGLQAFADALGRGESGSEAFRSAAAALRRHIYLEEEFLFPPLRVSGMIAPVAVMLREHGEIWRALDAIEASIADAASPDGMRAALEAVLGLLGDHNLKEERIVYPAVDQVVFKEQGTDLRRHLAAARPYAGWVCEAIRA